MPPPGMGPPGMEQQFQGSTINRDKQEPRARDRDSLDSRPT